MVTGSNAFNKLNICVTFRNHSECIAQCCDIRNEVSSRRCGPPSSLERVSFKVEWFTRMPSSPTSSGHPTHLGYGFEPFAFLPTATSRGCTHLDTLLKLPLRRALRGRGWGPVRSTGRVRWSALRKRCADRHILTHLTQPLPPLRAGGEGLEHEQRCVNAIAIIWGRCPEGGGGPCRSASSCPPPALSGHLPHMMGEES